MTERPSIEQFRDMLRALIEDRFQLKIHRETKELPAYALLVAKNGSKLAPAESEGRGIRTGPGSLSFKRIGMAGLAAQLSTQLGRVVFDKTGLTGEYAVTLEYAPEPGQGGPEALGLPPQAYKAPPVDDNRPSIFTALQEQLGLRLESEKGPVEMLVVDHVEKASGN
ncbi:MAG TPA: TIGR03435 family protein [Bryobacteraceae bacterium]|nr:TIGR03435 family protein [Bryobacteraceae bacterium]